MSSRKTSQNKKTYYDEIASGYDELHGSEQEKKMQAIMDNMPADFIPLKKDRLLDVGCGSGISTKPWHCNCVGIDPSKELISAAKKKNLNPDRIFSVGVAEDIKFADQTFDIVISATAIHNFENIICGLDEMRRVGKNRFIFSILKKSPRSEQIKKEIEKRFRIIKETDQGVDIIFYCAPKEEKEHPFSEPIKNITAARFDDFVKHLKKTDKIAVLHDTDPDGICSGVIAAKAVERIRAKKIDLEIPKASGKVTITKEMIETLRKNKINKLITTDLAVDNDPATVKEAEKTCEILVIDHHKTVNNISSEKTVFIKSNHIRTDIDASQYPASKLAYDLFSRHTDMTDKDWIAAAGTISDSSAKTWPEFIDSAFKRQGVKKKQDIFETPFGMVGRIITSTIGIEEGEASALFEELYRSEKPADFITSKFSRFEKLYSTELKRCIEECDKKAEFHDETGMIWYEMRSPYKINSPLSTVMSFQKYPDKTLLVVQDLGDGMISISARRQDGKVAMNALLQNATAGLANANGGGHFPAAGARVMKKDLGEFKRRVIKALLETD